MAGVARHNDGVVFRSLSSHCVEGGRAKKENTVSAAEPVPIQLRQQPVTRGDVRGRYIPIGKRFRRIGNRSSQLPLLCATKNGSDR